MSDHRDPDTRETTVIQTGERGGGGGVIVGLIAVLVIGALAFFFLGGYFDRAVDKGDINVNVAAPNLELPDVQVTPPASEPSNKTGN